MTSSYWFRAAPVLAAALTLTPAAALAQTDAVFRNVEVASGKPARLGAHVSVKPDCSPGQLPEIKVLAAPKNGALSVKTGKVKTARFPKCPNLETPAQGIFYLPSGKYLGSDEVKYEVRTPDGKVQTHNVRITVSDKPSAGAKPADGTDL